MKYLSDYTEEAQTKLFEKCGSFFAFSLKQLNEAKKDGVKYVNMGAGLICPKEQVQAMDEGLENIQKAGIEQDIKENGIENIIKRELGNHECYYTGNISDCVDELDQYGVTEKEILKVFKNTCESETDSIS